MSAFFGRRPRGALCGRYSRHSREVNIRVNQSDRDRVRLSAVEAQTLSEESLRKIGYDAEEARIIADHVVDAALCGYEYSGLPKILERRRASPAASSRGGRCARCARPPISALFDGGNNNGMVAMYRATQVAIAKAREHGFGGRRREQFLDERPQRALRRDGRARRHGRHPQREQQPARAAPGSAGACDRHQSDRVRVPHRRTIRFVIDLGTSAFMGTDLIFQERRDAVLPEGVAIDAQGRADARSGARCTRFCRSAVTRASRSRWRCRRSACWRARDSATTRPTAI